MAAASDSVEVIHVASFDLDEAGGHQRRGCRL